MLPASMRATLAADFGVRSIAVPTVDTLATMRHLWDAARYLACPHTAVGVFAALTSSALVATTTVGAQRVGVVVRVA